MDFSIVHNVRAAACDALEEAILAPYADRARELAPVSAMAAVATMSAATSGAEDAASATATPTPEACVIAPSPEVARVATAAGATRVYVASDELGEPGSPAPVWPVGSVPILDEVCRDPEHARIDPWVTAGASVAVGNVSELALAASCGAKAEIRGCIPIHNAFALDKLERAGAAGVWLSPELTLAEIQTLAPRANVPVGIIVSGRPRVMTSEHCVLKAANRCIHDCARCALRRRMISLRDRDGRLLPVRTDLNGRSRIYDAVPLDLTPQVGELIEAGVTRFAVDATLLNEAETRAAVERLVNALAAVREGRKPASRERHASSGHLFWGIG